MCKSLNLLIVDERDNSMNGVVIMILCATYHSKPLTSHESPPVTGRCPPAYLSLDYLQLANNTASEGHGLKRLFIGVGILLGRPADLGNP